MSNFDSSFSSCRQRNYYAEPQLELLEGEFGTDPFPSREHRRRIAQQINVTEKSVLVILNLVYLGFCLKTNRIFFKSFSGGFKIVADASATHPTNQDAEFGCHHSSWAPTSSAYSRSSPYANQLKSKTSPHTKFLSNLYSHHLLILDSTETLVSSNWPTDQAVPANNYAQSCQRHKHLHRPFNKNYSRRLPIMIKNSS